MDVVLFIFEHVVLDVQLLDVLFFLVDVSLKAADCVPQVINDLLLPCVVVFVLVKVTLRFC